MSWFLKVMAVSIVVGGGGSMLPLSPPLGLLLIVAGGVMFGIWFEEKKV